MPTLPWFMRSVGVSWVDIPHSSVTVNSDAHRRWRLAGTSQQPATRPNFRDREQAVMQTNQTTVDSAVPQTPLPVPELPPRVLLDLVTDCNLKCPMCIVHGATDDRRPKAF